MSNQTSLPTNLNSELESSTETSTSLRENKNSELPSIIRQNDDSDFSQNQGYNSPNIELSNATEDSTSRILARIHNLNSLLFFSLCYYTYNFVIFLA